MGEREGDLEDLMGELDTDFLTDGRGEALLFSLVSDSAFFFDEDEDEDLVKKPLMDDEGAAGVRSSGVLGSSPHGRFVFVVGDPCVKSSTLRHFDHLPNLSKWLYRPGIRVPTFWLILLKSGGWNPIIGRQRGRRLPAGVGGMVPFSKLPINVDALLGRQQHEEAIIYSPESVLNSNNYNDSTRGSKLIDSTEWPCILDCTKCRYHYFISHP